MRFMPSLRLTAAPARGGSSGTLSGTGSGNPSPPPPGPDTKTVPAGILPLAEAQFDDLTGWTIDPDWSHVGGEIQKTAGSVNSYAASPTITIPAGDIWVAYTVRDATAGVIGAQLQGPFANSPFNNRVTAQHVARFSGPAHTRVRLSANAAFDGTVEDMQAVDMTAMLAQPADIYIAAGQSLIAAESASTPVDPELDYWVPRCLYLPGFTNSTYGTVAGTVAACVAPLQMRKTSQGVSPMTSFARAVEPVTPVGRTVLIVGAAEGGTRLVGNDAEWNPDATIGNGATLYNEMVTQAQAALALNPGNRIMGLIWGQGESDRAPDMGTAYPPPFTALVSGLRTALSLPNLPVMLIGPMPDDTNGNQPLFIQTQERLDQDSGDATAIPGVHYVPRVSGYMSGDGTHPEPEGNRIAGRDAAAAFIALGTI